ncbi:MAG: cohesin domain-containing protein, partial [Saprospiraceae bacterium]
YIPTAIDNCHTPRVFQTSEKTVVNDCTKPAIFAGPDTLKQIIRTYGAIDESGNVADVECTVVIYVTSIDDFIWPKPALIQCDADYAKLANGLPSPVNIGTKLGSGVPSLYPWLPTIKNGTYRIGRSSDGLRDSVYLSVNPGHQGSAQVCLTAPNNITLNFIHGTVNLPTIADSIFYTVDGVWKQGLKGPEMGSSSVLPSVSLLKGQKICVNLAINTLTGGSLAFGLDTLMTGIPLTPDAVNDCNIFVTYTDTEFPSVKCVKKIMRKWTILEWSCQSKFLENVQIIEIIDTKGPEISGLIKKDVATTNGHTCEGLYKLQKPTLKDNCATNLTYDVEYPGGFLKGLKVTDTDKFIRMPLGCDTIFYIAFDECHNQTRDTVLINVEDNTAPVSICKQNTTIGLTQDGRAWVPATSFDNGSYDECELAKVLVRRMDASNCKPCKTPSFPGFTYLGEYINAGKTTPHYYYISKHKATPRIAIKTAEAMGGYAVAINNAAEGGWLHGKVKAWNLNSDYLIGLRDEIGKGTYTWVSGETSTYRKWATGQPGNKNLSDGKDSLYTIVKDLPSTGDSLWHTIPTIACGADEYLYVVEVTDPCGFSEYAEFCCADVATSPHMVQLRAIDKSGNWNDCMVNAFVQDKLPPTITCPPHMTVTCNDYFDIAKLRHSFGWATAYDNCENTVITTDSIIALNSCRIGTITRNFTATDPGGRTAKCTQIISVLMHSTPFAMTLQRWPRDTTIIACANPNDAAFSPDRLGKPDLSADNICTLVGHDYEDQIFTFNNSNGEACFKILRQWKVIDWCQQLSVTGGLSYAQWTHTQVIKISDNVAPVMTSSCAPKTVCTYDATCKLGFIELSATATDQCTEVLRFSWKVDLNNDGSFDSTPGLKLSDTGLSNSASASGSYPIGTHRIQWAFEDRCGNVTKCDQIFTVANCKAPTPYCINGLATSLMPIDTNKDGIPDEGMVEIWAKDFDNGSSHPCGYTVLLSFDSIRLDSKGVPILKAFHVFTCDDLGRNDVKLWAGVLTPMGTIVQDYCSTFISIQDNNKACSAANGRFVVSGTLVTEKNEPVNDVTVSLEGSEMTMYTNNKGTFNFEGIINGGIYKVKPKKNNDHINGVSTLDLVMIQRHILGLETLSSPYKLIAADINKDLKISASDLTELRRLILGVTNGFANNESWRFVDNTYKFRDVQNAHTEIFPESYSIDKAKSDMVVNFTSIKVGDVNGNAAANANSNIVEPRSANTLKLAVDNQGFTPGQVINVPVYAAQGSDVAGFQFTFNFDTELFNLEAVNGHLPSMTDYNFGFTQLANGAVAVSYNKEGSMDLETGAPLFTITLKAKSNGQLSQALWVNSSITKAEAYTEDYTVLSVDFAVTNRVAETAVLYQNTPNPFKSVTSIGFDLPSEMNATLTIYDVTGKTLRVINDKYSKGHHTVELNKNELGSAGVLYYTLEAEGFKATKKMVVIE